MSDEDEEETSQHGSQEPAPSRDSRLARDSRARRVYNIIVKKLEKDSDKDEQPTYAGTFLGMMVFVTLSSIAVLEPKVVVAIASPWLVHAQRLSWLTIILSILVSIAILMVALWRFFLFVIFFEIMYFIIGIVLPRSTSIPLSICIYVFFGFLLFTLLKRKREEKLIDMKKSSEMFDAMCTLVEQDVVYCGISLISLFTLMQMFVANKVTHIHMAFGLCLSSLKVVALVLTAAELADDAMDASTYSRTPGTTYLLIVITSSCYAAWRALMRLSKSFAKLSKERREDEENYTRLDLPNRPQVEEVSLPVESEASAEVDISEEPVKLCKLTYFNDGSCHFGPPFLGRLSRENGESLRQSSTSPPAEEQNRNEESRQEQQTIGQPAP